MKSVTGRYVNILVDKDEWLGNQRIVFQTVDLEAFREDGYVLSKAGERLFGNFFIREILQQDEVRWLTEKELRVDQDGIIEFERAIEKAICRFNLSHGITVDQVLLQFCGNIDDEDDEADLEKKKQYRKIEALEETSRDQRNTIAKLREENRDLLIKVAEERQATTVVRKELDAAMEKKKIEKTLTFRICYAIGRFTWFIRFLSDWLDNIGL